MLPLETLPGWPTAEDPGIGAALWVMVALPAAIAFVLFLFSYRPNSQRGALDDD